MFGRRVTGQVEFTVSVSPANNGVKLRRLLEYSSTKFSGQEFARRPIPLIAPAERARVFVNGTLAGEWYLPPRHARLAWLEDEFEIPGAYTSGKKQLRIRLEIPEDSRWSEFGCRVYQYLPDPPPNSQK